MNKVCLRAVLLLLLIPMAASAAPPDLRTPAPVIYLADNLDEKDKLGVVHRYRRTWVRRAVARALVQAAGRRRAVPLRQGGPAHRLGHLLGASAPR